VAVLVCPAASSAVSVYAVVLWGETWTQRLNAGQTGSDGVRVSPILHLKRYKQSSAVPRANAYGVRIETKNVETVSAHHLEGFPVTSAPLVCSLFLPGLDLLAGERGKPSRRKVPPKEAPLPKNKILFVSVRVSGPARQHRRTVSISIGFTRG